MRPPYLLLDIDGVLIPFPDEHGSTPATHTRHDVVPTGRNADSPVTVWLHPDHGRLLMDVIRTGLITPVWCTSWRQDSTTLIGPLLDLPTLPYVDLPRPQITTSYLSVTTSTPGRATPPSSGSTTTSPASTMNGRWSAL